MTIRPKRRSTATASGLEGESGEDCDSSDGGGRSPTDDDMNADDRDERRRWICCMAQGRHSSTSSLHVARIAFKSLAVYSFGKIFLLQDRLALSMVWPSIFKGGTAPPSGIERSAQAEADHRFQAAGRENSLLPADDEWVSPLIQARVPTFAISSYTDTSGFFFNKEFKDTLWDVLKNHTQKRREEDAEISLLCCLRSDYGVPQAFNERYWHWYLWELPQRAPERPYLIFSHGLDFDGVDAYRLPKRLLDRRDFLFTQFDLRGHRRWKNEAEKMPGVTMAPSLFYKGPRMDPDRAPKYLATFRGSVRTRSAMGSRHPRIIMREVVRRLNRSDIIFEYPVQAFADALQGGLKYATADDLARYADLMDTAYVLMLRGVERWSYRFSETIGACAIPVLLCDGNSPDYGGTLPFQELIDWRNLTVNLCDRLGFEHEKTLLDELEKYPEKLIEALPNDPETIRSMRRRICAINDRFFKDERRRAEATLASAAVAAYAPRAQIFAEKDYPLSWPRLPVSSSPGVDPAAETDHE